MLVSEGIERTYGWLHPSGVEKPRYVVQNGAITSGDLTVTVDARQDHIDDDAIIEWPDGELALLNAATSTTLTVQERGYMETTAASHADNERILIKPQYWRKSIFNAIVAAIEDLPGYGLWRLVNDTTTTVSTSAPVTLPANTKGIRDPMWVLNDSVLYDEYHEGRDYILIHGTDPPKLQFLHGRTGAATLITLEKEFTSPALEADDLTTTCGVPGPLARHLPMAAAGRLLAAKDLPKAAAEEIRRQIAGEGLPPGTATSISRSLESLFLDAVVREYNRQTAKYPTPTVAL